MKTEQILPILRVGAWVVFIGAIVRTVIVAITFVMRIYEQAKTEPESGTLLASLLLMSLLMASMLLYVDLWRQVKDVLTNINLGTPFTMETARRLGSISYSLLGVWIVAFIGKNYMHYIQKRMPGLNDLTTGYIADLGGSFDANGILLLNAGIVYIIAQVFRRGVELQQENELTI
jgi:hypothetical protein